MSPQKIWRRFRCIDDKEFVSLWSVTMIWFTYCLHLALGWGSHSVNELHYVIILFLSNISCLQLCQMFYRGQLCELDFQILDHKHCRRPPNFPSDLRHCSRWLYPSPLRFPTNATEVHLWSRKAARRTTSSRLPRTIMTTAYRGNGSE